MDAQRKGKGRVLKRQRRSGRRDKREKTQDRCGPRVSKAGNNKFKEISNCTACTAVTLRASCNLQVASPTLHKRHRDFLLQKKIPSENGDAVLK